MQIQTCVWSSLLVLPTLAQSTSPDQLARVWHQAKAQDQSGHYGVENDGSRIIFRVKRNKRWDPEQDTRLDQRMASIRTSAQGLDEAR